MRYTVAMLVCLGYGLTTFPALAQETNLSDIERLASSPIWGIALVIIWFLNEVLREQPKRREADVRNAAATQAMADAMTANAAAIQRLSDLIAGCPTRKE